MVTSAYGEILVVSKLEAAVRDLLIKRFPAYLREIERQVGWEREPLNPPKQYMIRNTFDVLPGEDMPKCVIVNPGLYTQPLHMEGDGYYQATWQINIGLAIAAHDEGLASIMNDIYGAAAKLIMLKYQDLEAADISVVQVEWFDENYDDIPDLEDQLMLYKQSITSFAVTVDRVANRWMKPSVDTEEPEVLTEVEEVIVEVNRMDED